MSNTAEAGQWPFRLADLMEGDAEDFYKVRPYVSVDSTNEVLKRDISGLSEGTVAAAAEQTKGKGRLGRSWASPMGEAAYFSFLLRPVCPPESVSMLTLLMGLSVAEAVSSLYGLPVQIKWPNDVVIDHRKICGILTEAVSPGQVIIGTGINVNNASFSEELAGKAISLRMALGREVPPELVTACSLRNFVGHYRAFGKCCDLSGSLDAYNALLAGRDTEVRVEDPADPHTGIARGIDVRGRLLVDRGAAGEAVREYISSGEVSVRGLYGYI